MVDVYTYFAELPPGIHEFITENPDGSYTIYLDINENREQWLQSYEHAIEHIKNYDFEKHNIQEIEHDAHFKRRYV